MNLRLFFLLHYQSELKMLPSDQRYLVGVLANYSFLDNAKHSHVKADSRFMEIAGMILNILF